MTQSQPTAPSMNGVASSAEIAQYADLKNVPPLIADQLLASIGYRIQAYNGISSSVEVSEDTKKIILPRGMGKKAAAQELMLQWENEEQVIDVGRQFEGWNWKDVLVAIKRVTENHFGWIQGKTVYSFFGTTRPTEIDIITDVKHGMQIIEKAFYGQFTISAFEEAVAAINVNRGTVAINTTCKKKYSQEITDFYTEIQKWLSSNSIYKGKAIVITGGSDRLNFDIIENLPSDKIVLNPEEQKLINNFVIPDLTQDGKRAYLFTGPYGNGKTETAMQVGVEANKKGLSFFYLKDADIFDTAIVQINKYLPAVLFVEDIDEIAAGEERDENMNDILNTMDGVQTKGTNLTVILTTNHENKINSALRRPGRIDLVIKFKNPQPETCEKIYRKHLVDFSGAEDVNYEAVVGKTKDVPGAVIAEICKRVGSLHRRDGHITTDTVEACILSMGEQVELMNAKPEDPGANLLDQLVEKIATVTYNKLND